MSAHVFRASRWTRGNHLFPTEIEVGDTFVVKRRRSWIARDEMSIHLQRVASVRIDTGAFFSDILIESSGGTDPLKSHGHRKQDARQIKVLIEAAQQTHIGGPPPEGGTRVCPFCAETVKAAATICRFCNRELPPLE